MTVHLPDGSPKTLPDGATALDLAESISGGLARAALSARVMTEPAPAKAGGTSEVRDLSRSLPDGATVEVLTWENDEGKATFWHSSAHLMAEALESLYPGIQFGIGPPVDGGFYYDVDVSNVEGVEALSSDDFPAIEEKMIELARQDNAYERRPVSKDEALAYFKEKGDQYKLELIDGLEDGTITFYTQGGFTDLCRGPHIQTTKSIKAVKLLSVAGAYWRGDEKRPQMTRIYGVSFPKKKLLDEHLERLELAKERDHRKLGRELGLFMFSEKVGPGLPIWLPKGATLRQTLEDYLKKEQLRRGYEPVITPHIGQLALYRTSGHYPYYSESQFPPMFERGDNDGTGEEENGDGYLLKPMNCPHHTQVYANRPHSYRELPVRLAEFGTVYRFEQSGELGGLTRVRGFTVDDAHIFCMPDQVKAEFKDVIDLTLMVLRALSFEDFTVQVSLRDPADTDKYLGDPEQWDAAEQAIREAVSEMGLDAVEKEGEAAFYGPKLDFMVKDALGRSWQLGTIQLDYNLPERFDLTYIDEDDNRRRPVMIHRAPFGSLERFIGVLIEHCGGNFPTWLAPVQVEVIPVSDAQNDYANEVVSALRSEGLRSEADTRSETVGRKIRDAEVQKVPWMLIVGNKEIEDQTVSLRRHGEGDIGTESVEAFVARIQNEIAEQIR